MKNAFLALRDEEIADFRAERNTRVQRKVEGRLRTAEMIGEFVELYFARFADTASAMAGGDPLSNDPAYLTILEDDDLDYYGLDEENEAPPAGPTLPDEPAR